MLAEFVEKILALGAPHQVAIDGLNYADRELHLVKPPTPSLVECSTLQGLVDLYEGELDDAQKDHAGDLLVQITSPQSVCLLSRSTDAWQRRRVWAKATYPECKTFPFGGWLDPETFIISAVAGFQRVKIENADGTFSPDLDYVLGVASKITSEHSAENADDGFAQRVTMKQGITLKAESILKPVVNLAPYRTFAEIDQVVSSFVFRARLNSGSVHLALFEADGGRWKINAIAAIKAWLAPKFGDVPVIS